MIDFIIIALALTFAFCTMRHKDRDHEQREIQRMLDIESDQSPR